MAVRMSASSCAPQRRANCQTGIRVLFQERADGDELHRLSGAPSAAGRPSGGRFGSPMATSSRPQLARVARNIGEARPAEALRPRATAASRGAKTVA